MIEPRYGAKNWAIHVALQGLIGAAMLLPYAPRIRMFGWLTTALIAPLAGWRRRIKDNLALVHPDLPRDDVRRLVRAVPQNVGRTFIESYSGAAFIAHTSGAPRIGPGVAAMDKAMSAGQPIVVVTAHFGNYHAARTVFVAHGFPVGAVYMPMSNGYFNARYVREMERLGGCVFPRSPAGLKDMMRHLKAGGLVAMVADHRIPQGEPVPFMGQPALTSLAPAELALKYNALLVPMYGRRQPDGVSFEVFVDAPIPHGTAREMTEAVHQSLERQIEARPDQWFWIHRRWKMPEAA